MITKENLIGAYFIDNDRKNIEVKDKRVGTMFERKDNKANINVLKELGWSPTIDLFDYLKGEKDGSI